MPDRSYEEKIEAMKNAAREVSGQGVGEKHDKAVKDFESQRKDLERSEKIGAFKDGVKSAVSDWMDNNLSGLAEIIPQAFREGFDQWAEKNKDAILDAIRKS